MSYPPQPGQDPNNPYAQQPQQGQQPGYGYPQGQQGGYGYPQQGGLPSYGGPAEQQYPMGAGYGAPMSMPGTVNAARIMLYVLGGLSLIGSILMFVAAAAIGSVSADDPAVQNDAQFEMIQDLGSGVIAGMGVLFLGLAAGGIVIAVKIAKGGNGLRIGAIVYGAVSAAVSLLFLPLGVLFTVLSGLIIGFVAKSDGKAWFNRPRY